MRSIRRPKISPKSKVSEKIRFFFGTGFQMLQKFVSPYLLGSKYLPGLFYTLFFQTCFHQELEPHHHIPTSSSQVWSLEYWGSRLLGRPKGVFSWGKLGRCFSCKAWRWTVLEHPENRWNIFFSTFEVSQSKQIWCLNLANTKKDRSFLKKQGYIRKLHGKLLGLGWWWFGCSFKKKASYFERRNKTRL